MLIVVIDMGVIKLRFILIAIVLLLIVISVPVTLFLTQREQSNQSKASAATTLFLEPATITALQNNQFAVDVFMDPGSNINAIVDAYIQFDPVKVEFVRIDHIPSIGGSLMNPVVDNGVLHESFGLPTSPETYIRTKTKIRTLIFKALSPGQVTISFDNARTRVLTLSMEDSPGENVLSNSVPTTVTIEPSDIVNPTLSPPLDPNRKASIEVIVEIPGISSQSAVIRQKRNSIVSIYDRNNAKVGEIPLELIYREGLYKGIADWDGAQGTTEVYTVKVKLDNSLSKSVPGIYTIRSQNTTTLNSVTVTVGDIDNNNVLDSNDYKLLTDCIGQAESCTETMKLNADINDNGTVDEIDLNIFQRGYSARAGD